MNKTIYTDEYRKLTDWLRKKRQDKGLTQREMAKILEWDNATVARVEIRERRLDIVEYISICSALDCDPLEGIRILLDL